MVSKCANPWCQNVFKYFRGGRLFLLNLSTRIDKETDFRLYEERSEYFWLCAKCAATMTMTVDQDYRPVLAQKNGQPVDKTVA